MTEIDKLRYHARRMALILNYGSKGFCDWEARTPGSWNHCQCQRCRILYEFRNDFPDGMSPAVPDWDDKFHCVDDRASKKSSTDRHYAASCRLCGDHLPCSPGIPDLKRDLENYGWASVGTNEFICHQCKDHGKKPITVTPGTTAVKTEYCHSNGGQPTMTSEAYYGVQCDCGRRLPIVVGTNTFEESMKAAGWVDLPRGGYQCGACRDKKKELSDKAKKTSSKPKGDIYSFGDNLEVVCQCGTAHRGNSLDNSTVRDFEKDLVEWGWTNDQAHGWSCSGCKKKRESAKTAADHATECAIRAAEYVAELILSPGELSEDSGNRMLQMLNRAGASREQQCEVNAACSCFATRPKSTFHVHGPRFKHGCTSCVFLGHFDDTESYDLYYCPQGNVPTVIARYGSADNEYLSGLGFTKMRPLVEAEKRARKNGLLVEDKKKVLSRKDGMEYDEKTRTYLVVCHAHDAIIHFDRDCKDPIGAAVESGWSRINDKWFCKGCVSENSSAKLYEMSNMPPSGCVAANHQKSVPQLGCDLDIAALRLLPSVDFKWDKEFDCDAVIIVPLGKEHPSGWQAIGYVPLKDNKPLGLCGGVDNVGSDVFEVVGKESHSARFDVHVASGCLFMFPGSGKDKIVVGKRFSSQEFTIVGR